MWRGGRRHGGAKRKYGGAERIFPKFW